MKNVLFFILSITMSLTVFSQKTALAPELAVYFNSNELTVEEIVFENYALEHGFKVVPFPTGKGSSKEISGEVELSHSENFHIYDLDLDFKDYDFQYFKILGTEKLLVISSREYLIKSMKKELN